MSSAIYAITSASGKRYIGSARDFERRKRWHLSRLRNGKHHSRLLQRAWEKYGRLEFSILLICREDDLFFYEQILLDNWKPEYNVNPSASGARGLKWSEASKLRLLGRKNDSKAISRGVMSASTPEERSLRSKNARQSWTPESAQKQLESLTGQRQSPETKKKRGLLIAVSWRDPTIREKRIAGIKGRPSKLRGRPRSKASIAKQRETVARRRLNRS